MSTKLQPVRGTHDYLGEDFDSYQAIVQTFEEVARRYNYSGIATPIFEYTQVFSKNLGDTSDIVTKEMYTFDDRGGESLTLRPEGTAPVVRAIISNGLTQNMPQKLFYHGPMFRYERPQKGRMRQLHQFGIECIGVDTPEVDVEVLHMAYQALKAIGVEDKITLELNTLGDSESRTAYRAALVTYFEKYLSELSEDSQRRLNTNPLRILDSKDENDKRINEGAPKLSDFLNAPSKEHFDKVCKLLEMLSMPYELNERLVRGLDYYNHTTFEFTTTHLGSQGAVLAGGRYNGLLASMGGPDLGGVGFGAGIERLMLLSCFKKPQKNPVAIIPLNEESERDSFLLAQQLREKGIACEFGFSGNAGKRIKRADKQGIKHAVLIDKAELEIGNIVLKDLVSGEQKTIALNQLTLTLQQL